jgi:hypothetical protein
MIPKRPIVLNILNTLQKNLKVKLITIIDVIVIDFLKVMGKILDILKLWVVIKLMVFAHPEWMLL